MADGKSHRDKTLNLQTMQASRLHWEKAEKQEQHLKKVKEPTERQREDQPEKVRSICRLWAFLRFKAHKS